MPHPALAPNNVAVITGGASGIGLAAAMRFARLGLRICIADVGADKLSQAAAQLTAAAPEGAASVMTAVTDVSNLDEVARLEAAVRERFGGTDVLMNNAGIQPGSKMFGPAENWQRILGVEPVGRDQRLAGFCARHDRARAAGPHHQYRLEAGHHHAARRSRLQCFEGGRESLHRSVATRTAQRGRLRG